jgi:hypothetical protein
MDIGIGSPSAGMVVSMLLGINKLKPSAAVDMIIPGIFFDKEIY